eukprot:9274019-Pyramimonas_sp.AAC.1
MLFCRAAGRARIAIASSCSVPSSLFMWSLQDTTIQQWRQLVCNHWRTVPPQVFISMQGYQTPL